MKIKLLFLLLCSARLYSEDVKWSITSSIWSQYLARPGFILYDGPTSQNDISISWNGMYAGWWTSTGLGDSDRLRQEYQLYIGYRYSVPLGIVLDGNIRYDAFNEMDSFHDDLWMVDMRVDFSKVPYVQPYLATRYFHTVAGIESLNGWFFWLGLRHVEKTRFANISLDTSVAYCNDVLNREGGWVYERSMLQFVIPITKQLTFTPQFILQIPLSASDFTSKMVVVGGGSLNYKF